MLNEEWMLHIISMLMLWNEIANYLILNVVERMLHIIPMLTMWNKCKLSRTETLCGKDAANIERYGLNAARYLFNECFQVDAAHYLKIECCRSGCCTLSQN
jgi:hypothetical protein